MSKLIISGGTGFLGTNLISNLICSEKMDKIWCVTRNTDLINSIHSGLVEYVNHSQALEIASNKRIDGIVHLATMYKRPFEKFDPYEMWITNVVYPTELLQAGKMKSTYFLNAASFLEFASREEVNPSYYVSTKRFYSETLECFRQGTKPKIGSLIIGDTFGKGDIRNKILNNLIEVAKQGKRLKLDNPDGTIRLSHVEHVSDALARMILQQDDSTLSAVSSTKIELGSLANFVYQVMNSNSQIVEEFELKSTYEVWNPEFPNNLNDENTKLDLFNFLRSERSS